MSEKTQIALIKQNDLSLCESNLLQAKQLQFILKPTPTKFIQERPAKGGGKWKFVSGGYIKKVLNIMFGWDRDFTIMEQLIVHGEVVVKGKLTVRTGGKEIVKMQFGNKDIVYKKELVNNERVPLSIGNDLKAAATDALKKCAAELGIAQDVYNASEFKEVIIEETIFKDVALMLSKCDDKDQLDIVWTDLTEIEQEKYLPLFKKLKNGF